MNILIPGGDNFALAISDADSKQFEKGGEENHGFDPGARFRQPTAV